MANCTKLLAYYKLLLSPTYKEEFENSVFHRAKIRDVTNHDQGREKESYESVVDELFET